MEFRKLELGHFNEASNMDILYVRLSLEIFHFFYNYTLSIFTLLQF